MDQVTFIGLLAGTLTTIAFIPQLPADLAHALGAGCVVGHVADVHRGVSVVGLRTLLGALPIILESQDLGADAGHSRSEDLRFTVPSALTGAAQVPLTRLVMLSQSLLRFQDTLGQEEGANRGPAAVNGDETRMCHCLFAEREGGE